MYENYDVAIIGGGPAAVFAAYEFTLKYPTVSLIMLEEGNPIERRQCPLAAKKVDHCLRCVPCDIMRGFGGAGAFSDGKYNFTTEFGGWLSEYIPEKTVIELIDYVDELNCRHGAPGEYFSTKNSTIGGLALGHDLHLLNAKVRHLGTENNLIIIFSESGTYFDRIFPRAKPFKSNKKKPKICMITSDQSIEYPFIDFYIRYNSKGGYASHPYPLQLISDLICIKYSETL